MSSALVDSVDTRRVYDVSNLIHFWIQKCQNSPFDSLITAV